MSSSGHDSIGRRRRRPNGTVQHSNAYWCVERDHGWHRAEQRHRVHGRQVALCAAHCEQWQQDGKVARRSGPGGGRP